MSDIDDRADQHRALEEYAHAGGQRNQPMELHRPPHGHTPDRVPALQEGTHAGTSILPIGAQQIKVMRERSRIMREIAEEAAAAGDRWYYRYPAKSRETGGTSYIEGPSVKLAEAVARLYMNNIVQVARVEDWGNAWMIVMRFCDLESGFILERPFQQSKAQTTIKTKDYERQQQSAFAIGVSKATRNVITNALSTYTDFAFEEAKHSLVEKIGRDLEGWRQRTIDSCRDLPVELARVERVMGRVAKDWLAPDIAKIVAMGRAVKDGMATLDETFPLLEAEKKIEDKPAEASTPPNEQKANLQSAAAPSEGETKTKTEQAPKTTPKNLEEYLELVRATADAATDREALTKWFSSEPQRKLRNTIGLVSEETNQAKAIINARVQELETEA